MNWIKKLLTFLFPWRYTTKLITAESYPLDKYFDKNDLVEIVSTGEVLKVAKVKNNLLTVKRL